MKLKKTQFWKTLELIKRNKKKSFYIFCFDALFLIVLLLLNVLVLQRMPEPYELYGKDPGIMLLFVLSYFAFLLLFYSLTKYFVLLVIKSVEGKARFSAKNYFRFVLLNLIISIIFFIILAILSMILTWTVKQENLGVVGAVWFIMLGLFSYLFFNISHVLFVLGNKVWESIGKSFAIIFKRGRIYFPVLLNIMIILLVYFIFTLLFTLIVKNIYYNRIAAIIIQFLYNVISILLFYVLLFFNRMQLFEAVKKL